MATKKLIGSDPSQISRNRDLGTLAFQNSDNAEIDNLSGSLNAQIGVSGLVRPSVRPNILVDFVGTKRLDRRMRFLRHSSATYYDDSQPEIAEQNLLPWSHDYRHWSGNGQGFGNGWDWFERLNAFGSGSVHNTTTAPDGTSTATLLTEDNTTGYHGFGRNIGNRNNGKEWAETWCLSIFVKNYSSNRYLRLVGMAHYGNYAHILFDITNGTVVQKAESNGYYRHAPLDGGIYSVGSGWYRVYLSWFGGIDHAIFYWSDRRGADTSDVYGRINYTGNGTSGFYFWGAQLETGTTTPRTYVPTNNGVHISLYQSVLRTADRHEPRFNHDPYTKECKGLLLENKMRNFIIWSEDFSKSSWTKTNCSMIDPYTNNILISGTVRSPNGEITTNFLREDGTASAAHGISCTVASLNQNYCYVVSIYAKAKDRTWFRIDVTTTSATYNVWYNLTTGLVGHVTVSGADLATAYWRPAIEDCTYGWYRCKLMFMIRGGTSVTLGFGIANDNGNVTYSGNSTSGLYIWGAQLEYTNLTWHVGRENATSYFKTGPRQMTKWADLAALGINTEIGVSDSSENRGISNPVNQFEGTIYLEADRSLNNQNIPIVLASNNANYPGYYHGSSMFFSRQDQGDNPYGVIGGYDYSYNQSRGDHTGVGSVYTKNPGWRTNKYMKPYKVAVTYKQNSFGFTINGEPVSTIQKLDYPSRYWNWIMVGGEYFDGADISGINGHVKRIAYYPKRISNEELRGLTYVDPTD